MRVVVVVVLLAACGGGVDPPCSVRCEDGCPSGMACSLGFCAADGETCEPAFERVSAGTGFACALDQFHRAWCWGANAHRQIADTDAPAIARAVVVGDHRFDSISVGGGHACGVEAGELWCWGNNDRHQVTSETDGDVAAPIRIEVDGQTVAWSRVAAGFDYTCGIGNARVFCWGANTAGKLGNGTTDDAEQPRQITSPFDDWTDVAANLRHTCAISTQHGVWCWGDGSHGQLGNGLFNVKLEPQSVDLPDATTIAVGLDISCATRATGELACWGRASDGGLGDPDSIDPDGFDRAAPTRASAFTDWVEVAAAERYACGRRGDGSVYCWGAATAGGLAGGRWRQRRTFARVIDSGATGLDLGWNGTDADPGFDEGDLDLSCAIVVGAVQCWGDNRTGQLGQGGASRALAPTPIDGDHTWTELAAGASHACGRVGTDVLCWGSVELGQVAGIAAGRDQPCTAEICDRAAPAIVAGGDELAVGANHACVRSGDQVACWGDSQRGQCGEVAPGAVPPQTIPGTWTHVVAAADAACGIDPDAATWCWGRAVTQHVPAIEPALDGDASALAFGDGFGCQLTAADALECFGDASDGVFGNGAPGSCGDSVCNNNETAQTCGDCGSTLTETGRSYTQLAIGGTRFACGIRADGGVECWGNNTFGQCGSLDTFIVAEPFPIRDGATAGLLASCTALAAGARHACAICGGDAFCWGDARHGELGAPLLPFPVPSARKLSPPAGEAFTQVTAGDAFACALSDTGRGYCWGSSLHGALGIGARGANLPVTVELGEGRAD